MNLKEQLKANDSFLDAWDIDHIIETIDKRITPMQTKTILRLRKLEDLRNHAKMTGNKEALSLVRAEIRFLIDLNDFFETFSPEYNLIVNQEKMGAP